MKLKNISKKIIMGLGYEIKKITQPPNMEKSLFRLKTIDDWIRDQSYKTVIDIGANEGQFALKIRALLPDAQIMSFEPINEVYKKLQENFKNDKRFIAYNIGLGDNSGEISFYINEYSPSSSMLEMNQIHKEVFDFATNTNFVTVKIEKLDEIINIEEIETPILLKIDVQGYEKSVLQGGFNVAAKADTIISEVSFKELYKDQPLFNEIYSLLRNINFSYSGNFEQLVSPINGEILQADAIFQKNK